MIGPVLKTVLHDGDLCVENIDIDYQSENISLLNVLFAEMGGCCCKLLRRQRRDEVTQGAYVIDLRHDPLPYPVQCTDADESPVSPGEPADDFVDLRLDVFPVQCTEPTVPHIPCCTSTTVITVCCLDALQPEFHATVSCRHQR